MTPKQELLLKTENAALKLMLVGENPDIGAILDDTARKIGGLVLNLYTEAGDSEVATMVVLVQIGLRV